MPVGYGVGDHRLFVIDFRTVLLVGRSHVKTEGPATRRLNNKVEGCQKRYAYSLERNTVRQRLIARVKEIETLNEAADVKKVKLDKIYEEGRQCSN